MDCPHLPWGRHNCASSEAVGLTCISLSVEQPHEVVVDGCEDQNTEVDREVRDGTASVRCCSMDGLSCTTSGLPGGCQDDKTFFEAQAICADAGLRLCSEAEVVTRVCCGTGCNFDGHQIWTDEAEAQLRLTSDSGDGSSGLLEVYHEGVWGTVCDDHFDTNNNGANVACRQLGFASGREYSTNFANHDFGFGLDDVQCTGSEASIMDCPHLPWGRHNCASSEAVGLTCISLSVEQPHEVVVDGCEDQNTEVDREVRDGTASVRCCSMDGLSCTTSGLPGGCQDDKTFFEAQAICADAGLRLCSEAEVVTRVCCGTGCNFDGHQIWTDEAEAQLRLTSDSGDGSSGLLEVYHEGEWGTVCDDHFDVNGANVACRQLGFASGTQYDENHGLHDVGFGLDDVRCTGSEASLMDCPHNPWGSHNCGAYEAVGLRCV